MTEIYRPATTLSILAMVGLGSMVLLELIASAIGIAQIVSPESAFTLDEAGSMSIWLLLQSLVALLQFPVFIATVVLFLVWLHRAHKNLYALRPVHLEFSSGWVVGWWFIPFANLVKPFQAVREVWWESDPVVDDGPSFLSASLHSAPTYMGLWWAFWLISNFASNVTSRVFDPEDMGSVEISGYLFVLTGICFAIAGGLAIYLVKDTTARQEARAAAVARLEKYEPPPPPTFDDRSGE